MLLIEFRSAVLNLFLDHAWKQWSRLGFAGQLNQGDQRIIDPESLLLFSTSIARYDQRLFDEILDWLKVHERLINIQRLKTLHKNGEFGDSQVVTCIAAWMDESNYTPKWKTLLAKSNPFSKVQPLFYLLNGKPLPVLGTIDSVFAKYGMTRNEVKIRNLTQKFQAQGNPTLLLQLRALLGLNCRSEMIAYMLTHTESKIQDIAQACGYSWKTVQDTLHEMTFSNILRFTASKKSRTYTLEKTNWMNLLQRASQCDPEWENWAALYKGFEKIWSLLDSLDLATSSNLTRIANFHYTLSVEQRDVFDAAGIGSSFGLLDAMDEHEYWEELFRIMWKRIESSKT